MDIREKLYLVKTRAFRAYVVGHDTEEAVQKFSGWLREHDYGLIEDRVFESLEVVANCASYSPLPNGGRGILNRGDDLLLI